MLDRRTVLARPSSSQVSEGLNVPAVPAPAGGRLAAPVLEVVWRRRWVVVAAVSVALAAAVFHLSRTPPTYASASRIYIEPPPKIIGEGVAAGPNTQGFLFTQCELMKSSAILAAAAALPEAQQIEALRRSDNPVGFLKGTIDTGVSAKGDIITVSAESGRPTDAALAVNAVVDAYIEHHSRRSRSTAGEVLAVLKKEKDGYEASRKTLSDAMLAFRQANGAVRFEGEKGNIAVVRLGELSDAVTKAQLATMDARVTLESAVALAKDPVSFRQFMVTQRDRNGDPANGGGVAGGLAYDPRMAELKALESKARTTRQQLGANHPNVKTAEIQAADLRAEIAGDDAPRLAVPKDTGADRMFVDNWLAVMKETLARSERREKALAGLFDAQQAEAVKLNAKAAELAQMEVDARRLEKVLDLIDTRMKEVNVAGNADSINSVTVLEVAKPDGSPVRPVRSRTLGLAVVVGLMLGLGGALALDWADQRVRSADEAAELLGIPVLGVVPHIAGKLTTPRRAQEIHVQPRSDVSEAYRTVRTAIYFGAPEVKSKTILVTSPSPGDGKSTLASNLALAIAQANRRALLIDADCRKPVQHRAFGLDAAVGLSTVLAGRATADEAIRKDAAGGLDVLPCGPLPPNPAEMLSGQGFADLIAELSMRYDQIVIDSPPVVAVTDARILAAAADVTVLVIRAEKSTRRVSAHARDALVSVGANLLGVIVNDVPRGRGRYGYYYGYGYGYKYGYGYGSTPADAAAASAADKHLNGHGKNGNGQPTLPAPSDA
ncbi:MAG: hypothetical protein JWO31_3689 [Phycisphaerales bacterium]|nr:hypothetical protein [Phycisphaerales bacterium]